MIIRKKLIASGLVILIAIAIIVVVNASSSKADLKADKEAIAETLAETEVSEEATEEEKEAVEELQEEYEEKIAKTSSTEEAIALKEEFKKKVQAKLDIWSTSPSFGGKTINIKAGETIAITDTKGVFADYNTFTYTKDGIKLSHK